MRTIERTSQFRKDYKREARGRYRATLDEDLVDLSSAIVLGDDGDGVIAAVAVTGGEA